MAAKHQINTTMSKSAALKTNVRKTTNEIERILNKKIYRDVSILAGGMLAFKFLEKSVAEWFRDKEGDKYEINMANLTYDANQYDIWANQLEADLKYFNWSFGGKNGKYVFPVMEKMMNDDDLKMLIKRFGKRCNYSFSTLFCNYKEMLDYWLEEELTDNELAQVNEILRNNGVVLQFST
jgi:tetrahydromethanopterin S-methyltransferase subunit G